MLGLRFWEHPLAGGLVQKIKPDHHHIPAVVLKRLLSHRVLRVRNKGFGHTDKAYLALLLQPQQYRAERVAGVFILLDPDAVQIKDIHIVGL